MDSYNPWDQYSFFSIQDVKLINKCKGWVLAVTLGEHSGSVIINTEDCGATWIDKLSRQNPILQALYILDNYGAWAVGISGVILSYRNVVGINDRTGETAQDFQLVQNYPNPFNPSTQIGFFLELGGRATLNIFDSQGREVANLLDRQIEQGFHSIIWNPEDLASGIYFYRLSSGGRTVTKKMLLLK